jgi:hypothetical protein
MAIIAFSLRELAQANVAVVILVSIIAYGVLLLGFRVTSLQKIRQMAGMVFPSLR